MPQLKFDPNQQVIIVETRISASHPTIAYLALDTGASFVVLPWRLTNAIGLKIDPKKTTHTSTASAVETVPEIEIPQMTVLGKTVKNVKAIIKDLPPGIPIDGLLGLSFLRHFKLTIDFTKGLLTLQ